MGSNAFYGFAFQIIGLQYTTPSKNAFLTALNVVIVPFIAFVILKKKSVQRELLEQLCLFLSCITFFEWKFYSKSGRWFNIILCRWICISNIFTSEFVKNIRHLY